MTILRQLGVYEFFKTVTVARDRLQTKRGMKNNILNHFWTCYTAYLTPITPKTDCSLSICYTALSKSQSAQGLGILERLIQVGGLSSNHLWYIPLIHSICQRRIAFLHLTYATCTRIPISRLLRLSFFLQIFLTLGRWYRFTRIKRFNSSLLTW